MGSACCRSSFFLRSTMLNDRALLLKNHSPGPALQCWRADSSGAHHPLSCAPAGAKNGIGLIKELFLPILDLILVYVKLLGNLCQRLVAFDRDQRHFRLEPRQMVSFFFVSSSSPVVVQITSGLSLMQLSQIRGPLLNYT
jgi:hypothetical protein